MADFHRERGALDATREQTRTAGTPLDPAKEAELQAIIESVKARDPGNNRLGRWEARRD